MSDDTPRPVATNDDKHTLTIEQVADQYARAGHARTVRTLQRYCKSGHLDCFKVPTLLGDEYRVTRESVERHLEQIREISATTFVATNDDTPRHVAHLENENEFLRGQIFVKDGQIETSNKQIAALTERVGESNKLVLGFQQLLGLRSPPKEETTTRPTVEDYSSVS
jgi:hypothetical protein